MDDDLKQDLLAAHAEQRRLRKALNRTGAELEAVRKEVAILLASRSWRVTAPLRALNAWLSRRADGVAEASDRERVGPVVDAVNGGGSAAADLIPAPLRRARTVPLQDDNDTYRTGDFYLALEDLMPGDAYDACFGGKAVGSTFSTRADSGPARIAFLGSRELAIELAFDLEVVSLTETGWRDALPDSGCRFLLVESVWNGDGQEWRHALIADAPARVKAEEVFRYCREIGIPIVFWFREIDRNYERFAWIAQWADRIYAVDGETAERFRRDFPDRPIEVLAPAIQPAMHNPVRSYLLQEALQPLSHHVLLDGWWDLAKLADADHPVHALGSDLLVTESEWDFGAARLMDLPAFAARTIGCLRPFEKPALSKLTAVELFLESQCQPAWRRDQAMLRSAACGSLVVQAGPGGIASDRRTFAPASMDAAGMRALLDDPLARARRAHLALREILSEHCLSQRVQRIGNDLGIDLGLDYPLPAVACVLVTMRPELLQKCLDTFRSDLYPNKELIVVLHGADFSLDRARKQVRDGEPIRIMQLGMERSLGACLNFALDLSDAPYWAKIDDDDLYGPHYLSDLMMYRRVVDFPLIGKPPMFQYLESGDELRWDSLWADHANLLHPARRARHALVAGGTLGGKREVFEAVRFSERRRGGSDSEFIRRAYEAGYDLLAVDGFNFVRFRSRRPEAHTWRLDDDEVRRRSVQLGGHHDISTIAMI